jgi:ferredoxin
MSGETSPIRLGILKFYAKREVKLLALLYRLLNSRLIGNRLIRELVYWILVVPTARWAVTGTPVAPQDLEEFVTSLSPGRIAIGPCRCRLAHGACDHPLETDIVIKQGFGIWSDLFPRDYREITAAEAVELCRGYHEKGLAQITYKFMDVGSNDNYFVVCNCCKDGCLPLLALDFYGPDKYPFHRGTRRAAVDSTKCRGCGTCIEVCPFGARELSGGVSVITECFGCGLCGRAHPTSSRKDTRGAGRWKKSTPHRRP